MAGEQARRTKSVRPLLIREHERLDALFVELLDEFREGDFREVHAMWARFESGLTEHLAAEERDFLPRFAEVDPGEALALRREHAAFRRALDELGVGVELHCVSLDVAQDLVAALRAHVQREDQIFYRWVERRLEHRASRGWRTGGSEGARV